MYRAGNNRYGYKPRRRVMAARPYPSVSEHWAYVAAQNQKSSYVVICLSDDSSL